MKKVKTKTTYAVVDIETTGGNALNGDKIIQFGCVLIEDGKIVQQFATDINPLIRIPKQIEHLTGITTKQVANAPYFEDVATTIYNLLEGCIFIAHNIQFDYQFLNNEFKQAGYPPLTLKGMDTVELAQILLPTAPSFRLTDLANQFHFQHSNPHQADSDAYVTGELFLMLQQIAMNLPLVTLEKMVELALFCSMNTNEFFIDCLEKVRSEIPPLPEALMIKDGLALQKKEIQLEQVGNWEETKNYPLSLVEKEQLFADHLVIRESQVTMMDRVFDTFQKDSNAHLAIEAATGVGKTLGYLIPLAYLADHKRPVVISTYTTLLQKQLIEKDIVQLNKLVPFNVNAAILKSKNHYLHLSRFAEEIKSETLNKNDALLKMRLLTWLTQTVTGDLDELNMTTFNGTFWKKVCHHGWLNDPREDPWYNEDFYLFAKKVVQQASIIITNHAFLCHDFKREVPELPEVDRFIIDEAHHLSDVAVAASSETFSYYQVHHALKLIGRIDSEDSYLNQFESLSKKVKSIYAYQLSNIEMSGLSLSEELAEFLDELLLICHQMATKKLDKSEEINVMLSDTIQWSLENKRKIKKISAQFTEICQLGFELVQQLICEPETLSLTESYFVEDFNVLLTSIEQQGTMFKTIFNNENPYAVTWFSYKEKSPKNSFKIKRSTINSSEFLKEHLVEQAKQIVYTGATLEIRGTFDYFEEQIGEKELDTLILASPYDYKNQARLYLPTEMGSIKSMSKKHYVESIVAQLTQLIENSQENIMVLFNAFEPLHDVYRLLQQNHLFNQREILAQGISGSRERILKRFFHANGGILLGADSFWEGVDLPGKSLRIIIVTRLPFDSPEQPFVKSKYHYLETLGENPFSVEALPKATLRLRQGLGRLIRSETDRGIMLVLDDRLFKTNYGKQMLHSLPTDLPKKELPMTEIVTEIQDFLS